MSAVNYSCLLYDVLFESAANWFAQSLIGVVLTGANADGAQGLKAIKALGDGCCPGSTDGGSHGDAPRRPGSNAGGSTWSHWSG